MNSKKNKHMTIHERIEIEDCLRKRMSFKQIASIIDKDPTTVSKEVKLHATNHSNSFVKQPDEICPKLQSAPYVCNGCKYKSSAACHYMRRMYIAKSAQEEYARTLVESREGIALNRAEFYEDDRIISEEIKAGQHINHIINSNNIHASKSSIYRYFAKNYFSVGVLSLPRAVKFKVRKPKHSDYVPKGVKIGRTYDDFVLYIENCASNEYSEFDTVIGNPGGKVIMTAIFPAADFMFGLLLDNKSASEAASKIIALKNHLAEKEFSFGNVFPVILTDNGGEFSDVFSFENDLNGNPESKIFFCDPMHSSQKPHVEKNHTLLRDILPKGSSFDNFTQKTVDLIFSHINSIKRNKFKGKSAYEMFSFLYSEDLASAFNITQIDAKKVIQSPKLCSTDEFLKTLI
jgi:transposase, IS30 family